MSEIKTGKITSVILKSEWVNPITKKVVYYHDILIDNGESASIGVMDKASLKIKKGAKIEYEIDDKGKMKIHTSSAEKKKPTPKENTPIGLRVKGQEAFLGYAWSYAKDLIIAGKTSKDFAELKKVASLIYDEIGAMINNEKK